MSEEMQKEWLEEHAAFLKSGIIEAPVALRQKVSIAINAGKADGLTMAAVHQVIKSAHLPAKLVNMIVDRLVDDGHVHRERIMTAGRPRVQLWSYRCAPKEARDAMAKRGLRMDYSRPFWMGKTRDMLIKDILRLVPNTELKVREIEIAAWQIYVDANSDMDRVLFEGHGGERLTYAEMKKLLKHMVLMRQIKSNARINAFTL